jgi:hypothetical protein
LLVEQIREVLDTILELGVELWSVVTLEIVRNNDSSLVLLGLSLLLHGVGEKIDSLSDLQRLLPLRFGNLRCLIVL